MRDAGGQLAERRHLLGLDQISLGSFQIAIGGLDRSVGFLCRIAGGADFLLVPLALGDIGVDQHEAAASYRVVTYFDNTSLWPGALIGSSLTCLIDAPAYLL